MKYNLTQIAQQLENELRERLNKSGLMFRLFSRVKTQRSIIHKMGIKGEAYRNGTLLMQDIIGFRVVLYFQDDVDIVALFLSSNGLVRKSIDEPDSSTFRPQRLNLTLSIPESLVDDFRHELPEEFAPYIGSTYEVQIRTIFSEGWHEVEHDLRYKCKEDWKYCSLTCANTQKTVTEAGHRWRAEQLRKDSCEICGTRSRLHAHHIDGNITHNWQGNIQTLCFDCHMAHHRLCRRLGRTVPGRAELRELQAEFPLGWTDLSVSETQSCPSSSTPSSGQ